MRRCWLWIAVVVLLGSGCLRDGVTIERLPEAVPERQFVLVVDGVCDALGPPVPGTFFRMRMVVAPKGSPPELWLQRSEPGARAADLDRPRMYQEMRFYAELGREARFLCVAAGSGEPKLVLLEPGELRLLRTAEAGTMVKATVLDWDSVAQGGRMDLECVWGEGGRALAFRRENIFFRVGTPIVLYEEQPQAREGEEHEAPSGFFYGSLRGHGMLPAAPMGEEDFR